MRWLTVRYLDQTVGRLADSGRGIAFEYDNAFIAMGQELSPLCLPLGQGVRRPGGRPFAGLFEDSLPDGWGRQVRDAWFRRHVAPGHVWSSLDLLAYVGARGMGALTYEPALQVDSGYGPEISLLQLYHAVRVYGRTGRINVEQLADVGSFAGGARPKALIALPRTGGGPILVGAGSIPGTHEAWMVKFDLSRDGTAGPLEEAYALMARAAGIDLPETRLLETGRGKTVRRHFAVKRFDRVGPVRIHHHTLASLCETASGELGYETLLRVTRRLTRDESEVWRAYRRAVFNVLANNRDDHGKNHGFVYRDQKWTLGPAYDLTFASPVDQPTRGLSVAGDYWWTDESSLLRLAESEGLDRRMALGVNEEVRAALARWREFADQARVPAGRASEVQRLMRAMPARTASPLPW